MVMLDIHVQVDI